MNLNSDFRRPTILCVSTLTTMVNVRGLDILLFSLTILPTTLRFTTNSSILVCYDSLQYYKNILSTLKYYKNFCIIFFYFCYAAACYSKYFYINAFSLAIVFGLVSCCILTLLFYENVSFCLASALLLPELSLFSIKSPQQREWVD